MEFLLGKKKTSLKLALFANELTFKPYKETDYDKQKHKLTKRNKKNLLIDFLYDMLKNK